MAAKKQKIEAESMRDGSDAQPEKAEKPKDKSAGVKFKSWRQEMKEARKRKKMETRKQKDQNPTQKWARPDKASETEPIKDVSTKKRKNADHDVEAASVQEEIPKKMKRSKGGPGVSAEQEDRSTPANNLDPEAFKVCVAGIPLAVDEKLLNRDFSDCGEILNLRLLKDRDSGNSRGIAFISFTDQASMDKALEFNGTDYGGRSLWVKVADRKGSGKGSGEASKGKGKEGKSKGKGKTTLGERPPGCISVILKGLAYSVTKSDLAEAFKQCGGGPTNIDILTDRDTGTSRGIGFLDFACEAAIDTAIQLNGSELKGRRFSMDYVAPREKAKGPGSKPSGCTSVIIKGLAYSVTTKELKKVFKACGSGPTNVRIVVNKDTGESRGMAFVDFGDEVDVDEAIKLHGTELNGRSFTMDYAAPVEDGGENAEEGSTRKAKNKLKGPARRPEGCTSIALSGLAVTVSEKRLMKTFASCGEGPRNVNIVMDKVTGESTGNAFVNFSSEAAIDEAMKLNGMELKGKVFTMGYVKPRKKQQK